MSLGQGHTRSASGAAENAHRGDRRDDDASQTEVLIRPWRPSDGTAVESLLDASADALWERQFHGLHGPGGEGSSWRRCRVATDRTDTVIGAATVILNPLHAGRTPCAIEVAPQWRRRGVGSMLLDRMRGLRPDASRPLSTKLRPDTPGAAFVARMGGRAYQHCPGIMLEASDPRVRRWAAAQPKTTVTDLSIVGTDALVASFADLYEWTHREWSPVTDTDELMQVSGQEVAEVDRALSTGAWVDGRLAALALAFPSDDEIEVVAETVRPTQPKGEELVAGAVAALLETLARRGGSHVYLDGHVTDPHLQPVLDRIPHSDTTPIDLLEIG